MAIKYITLISCFFLSFWGIDSLIDAEIEKFVVHPGSKSSNETDDDVPMIKVVDETKTSSLLFEFNNIPHHYTGSLYGTELPSIKATPTAFRVKKYPSHGHEPIYCLPFGIIGVTIHGVAIYSPYAKREGCKHALEDQLDACLGTTDENGRYHYYNYSTCVKSFKCNESGVENLYGVAIDGYPIYGPYKEGGIEVTSVDLDDCGGRKDRMGNYRYHIVADRQYFIYCLKGTMHKDNLLDFRNFVCDCPYQDAHFTQKDLKFCNETYLTESEKKVRRSTDVSDDEKNGSRNKSRNEELRIKECIPLTDYNDKKIDYIYWGGKPIRSKSICRSNTGYCNANRSNYENTVYWKQGEMEEISLITCCGEECMKGSKSCWITRKDTPNASSNVNSECVTPRAVVRTMTFEVDPNYASSYHCGGFPFKMIVLMMLFCSPWRTL